MKLLITVSFLCVYFGKFTVHDNENMLTKGVFTFYDKKDDDDDYFSDYIC